MERLLKFVKMVEQWAIVLKLVDKTDLKSVVRKERGGSSPLNGTTS